MNYFFELFLCSVLLTALVNCAGNLQFSYKPDSPIGPKHWHEISADCGGEGQSPINLKSSHFIRRFGSKPFQFLNFDAQPQSIEISNDGNYAKYTPMYENGTEPCVASTLTPRTLYCFDHFHFHWGAKNKEGSEHSINSKFFTMEMHVVFYNKQRYASIERAKKGQKFGILVMGYFFKKGIANNIFSVLSKFLPRVTKMKDSFRIDRPPFTLQDIVGHTRSPLINYIGSLTTPECSGNIVWLLPVELKYINKQSLARFRVLEGKEGKLSGNYRPIQPTNGRKIFLYI